MIRRVVNNGEITDETAIIVRNCDPRKTYVRKANNAFLQILKQTPDGFTWYHLLGCENKRCAFHGPLAGVLELSVNEIQIYELESVYDFTLWLKQMEDKT